jgi:DNA-binding NarL/FixJ family response regulator
MPSPTLIRIVLVDDHAVVRAGYRRFLEQEPGYEVIAEAASAEELYALLQTSIPAHAGIPAQASIPAKASIPAQASAPDVIVLDLSMPGQGGLAMLRRIKARWPLVPVLVFSMHDNLAFAVQALRAGANGYLTKSSEPALMVSAVRRVVEGLLTVSPDIERKIAHSAACRAAQPTLGLSVREFDVFRLIASGRTHEQIAALLNLSVKTVANNHSLIRQKLEIATDIELLQLAVQCGAVEPFPRQDRESPSPR